MVPVCNAGPYLERCLQSLIDQTLDHARYDVIAVDDGSTDGSGERLDRLAIEHPGLVRVEHIANSGWPGRPRNVGTDLSTREYVFYCDADDWLMPQALEAMLSRAVADDAELVMVRPVGNRRRVPTGVFDRGDRCTNWRETPGVFTSLTCMKLFSTTFLRTKGVRFDEGPVRLEDFIFMTAAYLRAERIGIVGSQPCYVFERRDDGGNLTSTPAAEDDYWASVEKIIDVVLAETEPGPEQDLALNRVIRSELMGPLSRPPLLRKSRPVQAEAVAHGRRLLRTKVPPSAVARLDVSTRNWIGLVERGEVSAIVRRIEAEAVVTASALVRTVAWAGSQLQVDLTLALEQEGTPLVLECVGAALLFPRLDPGDEPHDVTTAFAATRVQVRVRGRDRSEEWRVPVTVTTPPGAVVQGGRTMTWAVGLTVDVRTLASGKPLHEGVWDLLIELNTCGYRRTTRIAVGDERPALTPMVHEGVQVRPYWTQAGGLAVAVTPAEADRRPHRPSEPRSTRTWRRRAVSAVGRLGLTVTDVGPGVVLLSRSSTLDVAPLAKGRSWLVSKRRNHDAAPVPQRLGERHWVVPRPGDVAAQLELDPVGRRGWLVSRPEQGSTAGAQLVNQTLHLLGAQHVNWLLDHHDIDLVLDVGANTGQYGQRLRSGGFTGRIVSFEPVPTFADAVEELARDDEGWTVQRVALGRSEGTVPIRIQRTFSSVLAASDYGKARFATLRDFAGRDEQVVDVPLRRLDAVLDELLPTVTRADGRAPRVFLKMDTQGFDLEVFRGLGEHVRHVVGLQSEVALLLIYEGMPRMPEVVAAYEDAGFQLTGMYPVTTEPDGRVIEYDCMMVRP